MKRKRLNDYVMRKEDWEQVKIFPRERGTIKRLCKKFTQTKVAGWYGVSQSCIWAIVNDCTNRFGTSKEDPAKHVRSRLRKAILLAEGRLIKKPGIRRQNDKSGTRRVSGMSRR